MKKEEIAQWVIDNRFAKSENEKTSNFEMYHFLNSQIGIIESENERLKAELLGNTEQLKAESKLTEYKLLAGEACFETLSKVNDAWPDVADREWISIKDKKPDPRRRIWGCVVGNILVMDYYYDGRIFMNSSNTKQIQEPDYWMYVIKPNHPEDFRTP